MMVVFAMFLNIIFPFYLFTKGFEPKRARKLWYFPEPIAYTLLVLKGKYQGKDDSMLTVVPLEASLLVLLPH
jgi:hypothetical protein